MENTKERQHQKEPKELGELIPPANRLPLENSEEEILTQEEIDLALRYARQAKRAEINRRKWLEDISKPQSLPVMTGDQMYEWVMKVLSESVTNLKLTPSEDALYKNLSKYFSRDDSFEGDLNKGLWFFGSYGCGKTTIVKAFARNPISPFPIFSSRVIADEYKNSGSEVIYKYSNYPGICFDDLGTDISETGRVSKHFGNEKNVMAEIILNRYDYNPDKIFRTHFTTNLTVNQVEGFYGPRVRSRLREMCNIIEFPDATDKRK